MELSHIAFRALFVYIVLLVLVRLAGKRTVLQATPIDLTMLMVLGDLIDDGLWAEVPAAQFVVAAATLCCTHVIVGLLRILPSRLMHERSGRSA